MSQLTTQPGFGKESTDGATRSRLIIGLAIVFAGIGVFGAAFLLLPISRLRTVIALLAPMATVLTILFWWYRNDSLSQRTRTAGLALAVVGGLVLVVILPFPTIVMAILWGLPASLFLTLVVFATTRRLSQASQLVVAIAACAISLVPWMLVRLDGASGQMMPRLVWVWDAATNYAPAELAEEGLSEPAMAASITATSRDWPGFLGARRDGIVPDEGAAGLDLNWDMQPPVEAWRRALGKGWSSFVVVGDLACTQDQAGTMERVVCLDAAKGTVRWIYTTETRFEEVAAGPGPRATPLIHSDRVFSLGATGRLDSLEARTGEVVWSLDLSGEDGATPFWGFASSPLIHGGLLFVSPSGVRGARMLALDHQTGERVWVAEGEFIGYGSPQLAILDGTPQVLLFDSGGLVSFEPRTGEVLWEYNWHVSALPRVAQPRVGPDDTVIVGMGYGYGTKSLGVIQEGGGWVVQERWSTPKLKPNFNNFIVKDGYIYGLDEGILVCLDAQSGERLWKKGRYGYGQILLVGRTLLIVTESGDLVLVEAAPTGHRELARLVAAMAGKSWAHPAVARGRLYIRNGEEAISYDLGASSSETR